MLLFLKKFILNLPIVREEIYKRENQLRRDIENIKAKTSEKQTSIISEHYPHHEPVKL